MITRNPTYFNKYASSESFNNIQMNCSYSIVRSKFHTRTSTSSSIVRRGPQTITHTLTLPWPEVTKSLLLHPHCDEPDSKQEPGPEATLHSPVYAPLPVVTINVKISEDIYKYCRRNQSTSAWWNDLYCTEIDKKIHILTT